MALLKMSSRLMTFNHESAEVPGEAGPNRVASQDSQDFQVPTRDAFSSFWSTDSGICSTSLTNAYTLDLTA